MSGCERVCVCKQGATRHESLNNYTYSMILNDDTCYHGKVFSQKTISEKKNDLIACVSSKTIVIFLEVVCSEIG